jgi:hypothetical protein
MSSLDFENPDLVFRRQAQKPFLGKGVRTFGKTVAALRQFFEVLEGHGSSRVSNVAIIRRIAGLFSGS